MAAREPRVLGMVLAGGEGKRLWPLTADRAKPAVPFGGNYRLIDFVLSNLVNAGYLRICVLTQYKSHSLDRHITQTWRMSTVLGNYVTPVPAQQRLGPRWYTGSADAILQSSNLIYDDQPDYIVVFGADHVYRMDPRQMVEPAHRFRRRGRRSPGSGCRASEAEAFGVIDADADNRVLRVPGEAGEPARPARRPRRDVTRRWATTCSPPRRCIDALRQPTPRTRTRSHDMGGSIMPMMVKQGAAYVYDFADNDVPGAEERDRGYWRDVGTIDAYYDAHMDLVAVHPIFNLYNQRWPIYTHHPQLPPAKFVEGGIGAGVDRRRGHDHRPARPCGTASSPRTCACTRAPTSRAPCSWTASRSAGARSCGARSSTRTSSCPTARTSASTPTADRARYHVSEGGIVVLGKGQLALP